MIHYRHMMIFLLGVGLICWGCKPNTTQTATLPSLAGHNVLLITLDTTRADRLGCYGYSEALTPTLDTLADHGVLFEDAQVQIPLTLPSHCSLMTGRYPNEHGVIHNARAVLGNQFPTLASVFKDHRYRTAAFVSSFVLDDRFGLHRSFDVYDDYVGQAELDGSVWELERPADAVTDRALAWLQMAEGEPFYCWIHYYDPHDPYDPPPSYLQRYRDPYDGEISFMDAQIRRIYDLLLEQKIIDKTLIVVVGDHGESLGEHQEWGHVTFLYDTHLHVPMIFTHPTILPKGLRITTTVSLVDVFPTVLDLFGWDVPEGLLSRSLVPVFTGVTLDPIPSYAQNHYAYQLYGWAQQHSLTTSRWKYISSAKPELYDRRRDRDENHNLIQKYPEVAASMLDTLKQLHDTMTATEAPIAVLDQDAIHRLEALGYLSGGRRVEAKDFLTPGLNDPKDFVDVLQQLKKTSSLIRDRRFSEAIPILESVVKRCPDSVRVHHDLGKCYMKMRRLNKAVAELNHALQIDSIYRPAHRTIGHAFAHAGKWKKAVKHYEIALQLKADDPQTHYNLGTLFLEQKQLEKGIEHLKKAVLLKPDYTDAVFNLGIGLIQVGDLEQAEKILLQAAGDPTIAAQAYQLLGSIASERGDIDGAMRHYEQSLKRSPDNERIVRKLLRIYKSRRHPGDAIRILQEAVSVSPNHIGFLQNLAMLLATTPEDHLRDGPEALRFAIRAAEISSYKNPTVLATLAVAHAETGDFTQAIETAQQALQLAQTLHQSDLAGKIRTQIIKYRKGETYRTTDSRP